MQELPHGQLAIKIDEFIENIYHARKHGLIDNTRARAIIKKIKENIKCNQSDMSEISSQVHFMVKDYKEKHEGKKPTGGEKVTMHLRVTCGFIARKLDQLRPPKKGLDDNGKPVSDGQDGRIKS